MNRPIAFTVLVFGLLVAVAESRSHPPRNQIETIQVMPTAVGGPPAFEKGLEMDDLLAQIQALQTQVNQLRGGNEASSTPLLLSPTAQSTALALPHSPATQDSSPFATIDRILGAFRAASGRSPEHHDHRPGENAGSNAAESDIRDAVYYVDLFQRCIAAEANDPKRLASKACLHVFRGRHSDSEAIREIANALGYSNLTGSAEKEIIAALGGELLKVANLLDAAYGSKVLYGIVQGNRDGRTQVNMQSAKRRLVEKLIQLGYQPAPRDIADWPAPPPKTKQLADKNRLSDVEYTLSSLKWDNDHGVIAIAQQQLHAGNTHDWRFDDAILNLQNSVDEALQIVEDAREYEADGVSGAGEVVRKAEEEFRRADKVLQPMLKMRTGGPRLPKPKYHFA